MKGEQRVGGAAWKIHKNYNKVKEHQIKSLTINLNTAAFLTVSIQKVRGVLFAFFFLIYCI